MAKQIRIRCPAHVARLMIDALKWFIERNYPSGADECSIAARDALYGLAARFEDELLVQGQTTYSIRMRAFLCEAVRSYLAMLQLQSGDAVDNRCQVLIDVCRGNSDGTDFDAAVARDALLSGGAAPRGSDT